MRQPTTALPLVHAEPLEPAVKVLRERARGAAEIAEDRHSDAPGLAIPTGCELDRPGGSRGPAKRLDDRGDLRGREASEERERDVHVLAWTWADAFDSSQLAPLPVEYGVEHCVG